MQKKLTLRNSPGNFKETKLFQYYQGCSPSVDTFLIKKNFFFSYFNIKCIFHLENVIFISSKKGVFWLRCNFVAQNMKKLFFVPSPALISIFAASISCKKIITTTTHHLPCFYLSYAHTSRFFFSFKLDVQMQTQNQKIWTTRDKRKKEWACLQKLLYWDQFNPFYDSKLQHSWRARAAGAADEKERNNGTHTRMMMDTILWSTFT